MTKNFLTPVTRTTLTSDICTKLVNQLARGDWKEGDRIPSERELGHLLGVGRASLREALKALEIMGMIETRMSISRPDTLSLMRPSCGTRFSAMFSLAMIFKRLMIAA